MLEVRGDLVKTTFGARSVSRVNVCQLSLRANAMVGSPSGDTLMRLRLSEFREPTFALNLRIFSTEIIVWQIEKKKKKNKKK